MAVRKAAGLFDVSHMGEARVRGRDAADIAAKGGHFVDTPLTRTPKEAEEGKLGLMMGGALPVLDRLRPVLETFTDTIVLDTAGPVLGIVTLTGSASLTIECRSPYSELGATANDSCAGPLTVTTTEVAGIAASLNAGMAR